MSGKSEGKKMHVLQAFSLRDIVEKANASEIQKEDIVQMLDTDSGFFLLYYK